jgi:hypothetical protein
MAALSTPNPTASIQNESEANDSSVSNCAHSDSQDNSCDLSSVYPVSSDCLLPRVSHACSNCKLAKAKCDLARPCARCTRTGRDKNCTDSIHQKRGRKNLKHSTSSTNNSKEAKLTRALPPETYQNSVAASTAFISLPTAHTMQQFIPATAESSTVKRVKLDNSIMFNSMQPIAMNPPYPINPYLLPNPYFLPPTAAQPIAFIQPASLQYNQTNNIMHSQMIKYPAACYINLIPHPLIALTNHNHTNPNQYIP